MLCPTAAQRLPRAPAPSPRPARSRARGRHRALAPWALAPWALAAAARLCHVRRAKREAPDFQSFSEDLLVVIQDAEKSAATLKQGQRRAQGSKFLVSDNTCYVPLLMKSSVYFTYRL